MENNELVSTPHVVLGQKEFSPFHQGLVALLLKLAAIRQYKSSLKV
jgi:hypothetical protein